MQESIPKIIHFCWFGGKELPDSAKKCIDSWKKYCPDYQIIRWDENNYDFDAHRYAKEAYEARRWAFVSDYARFDILDRMGGIYFDTDVELINTIDDIVMHGPFMGCEKSTTADGKHVITAVATGLGIGTYAGNAVFKEILRDYEQDDFQKKGIHNTVVSRVTEALVKKGFVCEDRIQVIDDVTVYPSEYFCPIDNMTGKLTITNNTRSIHHYDATWMNTSGKISIGLSRRFSQTGKVGHTVGVILSIPFRVVNKLHR